MKKNDLIKVLENISGNPEIMLWDELVNDLQEIDSNFVPKELSKEKIESIHNSLKDEWSLEYRSFDIPENISNDLLDKAKQIYQSSKFEYLDQVDTENYIIKDCLAILPIKTGKLNIEFFYYQE